MLTAERILVDRDVHELGAQVGGDNRMAGLVKDGMAEPSMAGAQRIPERHDSGRLRPGSGPLLDSACYPAR